MQSTRSLKDRMFLVIKGLAMGAANKGLTKRRLNF